MTILTETTRASSLTLFGEENNPFVTSTNELDNATLTTDVGTEDSDGAAANAASGTTYDYWIAAHSSNSAALQAVFSSNVAVTFAGLAAHNLGDLTATVSLQYSTDSGSSWTDCGCGSAAPTTNEAIGFRFQEISADYWRILVEDISDDVSLGVWWLGKEIIIPQRIYQGYAPPITPTNVVRETNVSAGGQILGSRIIRRGSSMSADLSHIKPDFIRGSRWTTFQRHANDGKGFFWGWRPEKYGDLFYGIQSDGSRLIPENTGPRDFMSFTLSMELYDDE